jgi:hypothetical protein
MALRYKHSRSAELRAEASGRALRWVLALVSDEETTTAVSISGSECGHAACGANDTTVLLMRAGERARFKISKPLEAVTQAEIADTLASLVTGKEVL